MVLKSLFKSIRQNWYSWFKWKYLSGKFIIGRSTVLIRLTNVRLRIHRGLWLIKKN